MGSYQWYVTEKRRQIIAAAEPILQREGLDLSQVLEELLAKWVAKKDRTHNPQTTVDDYQDPAFKALPNLWTIDGPGDLAKIDSETLEEVLVKARQLEFLASRRLKARGVG